MESEEKTIYLSVEGLKSGISLLYPSTAHFAQLFAVRTLTSRQEVPAVLHDSNHMRCDFLSKADSKNLSAAMRARPLPSPPQYTLTPSPIGKRRCSTPTAAPGRAPPPPTNAFEDGDESASGTRPARRRPLQYSLQTPLVLRTPSL